MKKSKMLSRILSTALASAVLLAGCGQGQQSSTSNGADTGAGSSGGTTSGSSGEAITLKLLSPTVVEKPEGEVEKYYADEYMKQNPHVKIEFIGVPMNEVYAKLTTMATGGEVPDIFINSPEFYGKAYEMGLAENLTPILGDEYIKGFYPATLNEATIDGQLQFVPWFTIPTGLLFRKDWFEQEGITPPKTWDEFLEAAKKMTKDTDGDGKVDRWGFAMVGTKNGSGGSRFVPIMHTFGASELVQNDKGEWETQYDSPEAIEAFKFFGELVTKHDVVPPGPLQTGYAEAVSLMASEKTAMMVTGPHTIGAILKQNPDLKGKIAGIPLPHAPGKEHAAVLGMLGFSVSANSKHKEEAVKYLKFMLSKENQLKWNEVTGRIPARIEAGDDPQVKNPELEGFIQALDYAFPLPNVPYYAKVQLTSAEAYQAVITKAASPEEAAKKAAETVRIEIKNNQ